MVVVAGLVGCFNAAGLVGCFCSGGFGSEWFRGGGFMFLMIFSKISTCSDSHQIRSGSVFWRPLSFSAISFPILE